MKAIITLAVFFMLLPAAYSQGTVRFLNDGSTLISYEPSGGGPAIPLPAVVNQFYFALFIAPVGTTNRWDFTYTGYIGANQAVAGRFSGGVVALYNHPAGTHLAMLVKCWSANAGRTWPEAEAYIRNLTDCFYYGESGIASDVVLGGGAIPAGTIFHPVQPGCTPGFTLLPPCPYSYWGGFLEEPRSQTVSSGGTATFRVFADALPFPNYQWYFNGSPILSATNSAYQILHVEKTQAGKYHAVARVLLGGPGPFPSQSATLTVVEGPSLRTPIPSQTAVAGSNVHFQAHAQGDGPLSYQWFFQSQSISPGGTNPGLWLKNVGLADAGAYTVVISNLGGMLTSPPIALAVIPPVPMNPVRGIKVQGTPGNSVIVEAASDPVSYADWAPVSAATLSLTQQWFFDSSLPLPTQRFYRARQSAGDPGPPMRLEFQSVPALHLTGAVNDLVRVDYINQYGPTDAWLPLATVQLTNTGQDYFDTSSIGQPTRLYRTGRGQ
jgi:hypothetical protein